MKTADLTWRAATLADSTSLSWLDRTGTARDVVVSSRARLARNLVGFRFPHLADDGDLAAIQHQIRRVESGLQWVRSIDAEERSFLLRCRLLSPEFRFAEPGRVLGIASTGNISMMVNEEDHIRAQALVGGWDFERAESLVRKTVQPFEKRLNMATDPRIGYLTASPINAGRGARISAMFHLVGLARQGRLRPVLKALSDQSLMIRGLYGEGTRPIGAFFQISMTRESHPGFVGACEYLIQEERAARAAMDPGTLWQSVQRIVGETIAQRGISYEQAMSACAWIRWGASCSLWGPQLSVPRVDRWLVQIPLGDDRSDVARIRAAQMRELIEPLWLPNRSAQPEPRQA